MQEGKKKDTKESQERGKESRKERQAGNKERQERENCRKERKVGKKYKVWKEGITESQQQWRNLAS